jgi:hypothetical protein
MILYRMMYSYMCTQGMSLWPPVLNGVAERENWTFCELEKSVLYNGWIWMILYWMMYRYMCTHGMNLWNPVLNGVAERENWTFCEQE